MTKTLLMAIFAIVLGSTSATRANFTCANGNSVPLEYFCDGDNDCDDGSDERNETSPFALSQDHVLCHFLGNRANHSCLINHEYICNGIVACRNVTPCDVGCSTHYRCANTSCFPKSTLCDGNACNGCPEDVEWSSGIGFKCFRNGRKCILPQQLLQDDIKDCDGGEDLCLITDGNRSRLNTENCFQCFKNETIIPRSKVCDQVIDCPDLSDECLCEGKVPDVCYDVILQEAVSQRPKRTSCGVGEFSCGNETCIKRTSVCDGIKDCRDAIDESFDSCRGTLSCKDGDYILANQTCRCDHPCKALHGVLCDGKGDCPVPLSGHYKWLLEPGFPDDECLAVCFHPSVPQFQCTSTGIELITDGLGLGDFISCFREIPSGDFDLPPAPVQVIVHSDQWCDGVVDCPMTGDDESVERCPHRFRCKAGHRVSIASSQVCDGIPDCDDISDEINNTCADRFFCPALNNTKISIDRNLVCDFVINCDDATDEKMCFDDERFYCEAGTPLFVSKKHVFDGRGDCMDWSDECPTDTKATDENIFSSRYELIANPVLRALVWVMGTFAVIGNACVLVGESKILARLYKKSGVSSNLMANHMLVFNLAIADFLMGIYLLILGAMGLVYSGVYCANKVEWLSSTTCSALGVLVVASSETSVITMVLLTSFRLHAVFRPFDSSTKPGFVCVLLFIALSWTLSLTTAILPLSRLLEGFFVDKAVLPNNPFFENVAVDFEAAKDFVKKLQIYDSKVTKYDGINQSSTAHSWSDLLIIASRDTNHPEYVATSQWIGYYSANSVCIPKLFVTPNVAAWSYSFGIVLSNFAAFVFVTVAYVMIFTKSKKAAGMRKSRSLRNVKLSKTLQRRIIRLVATDFFCWVPISVMTFLSLIGVPIPEVVYVISAAVLLPINSALNPILYSNFLDKYAEKAWKRTTTLGSTIRTNATMTSSMKTPPMTSARV